MRKIADVQRVLCASPAYLERRGVPQIPADLSDHDCLLLRYPGSTQSRWPLTIGGTVTEQIVTGPYDVDDGDVLTEWALLGLGITFKPLFEIAEHLRSGALVQVLPDFPPQPATLAVLYPYRRMVPTKVRLFADMLVEEARAHIASALREPLP